MGVQKEASSFLSPGISLASSSVPTLCQALAAPSPPSVWIWLSVLTWLWAGEQAASPTHTLSPESPLPSSKVLPRIPSTQSCLSLGDSKLAAGQIGAPSEVPADARQLCSPPSSLLGTRRQELSNCLNMQMDSCQQSPATPLPPTLLTGAPHAPEIFVGVPDSRGLLDSWGSPRNLMRGTPLFPSLPHEKTG